MEFSEVVHLNVGGQFFTTSLATITRYPDTRLAAMFSGRHHVPQDHDDRYFIDVDGDDFIHILNFLRCQKMPPGNKALDILQIADYFGLTELTTALTVYMPVMSFNLFQNVRKETTNYTAMLQSIHNNLCRNVTLETSILIAIVNKGSSCKSQSFSDSVTHEIIIEGFRHICVYFESESFDVATVATALVHDLKVLGASPMDDHLYKADDRCKCTGARKIKLDFESSTSV